MQICRLTACTNQQRTAGSAEVIVVDTDPQCVHVKHSELLTFDAFVDNP